ncbi:hypothetical protein TWF225_003977 [Orbilia oligospora]|uniref:Uncharacterized protein n=1 Tax=Orbilia oligospora TaxID=2813651 RepID=A0A8H2DQL2_ORBOL|nr:hypothetical protein TWF225_003977 [Orbilia oligospora]TGJ62826.1 hypothetical protein EYR41_012007 [Orbilia oligospora]
MYRNEADKPTPFSHKRFPRGKERQLDSSRDRSSRALPSPLHGPIALDQVRRIWTSRTNIQHLNPLPLADMA